MEKTVAIFNLIVFINDPERRAWIQERAHRIAEKHPSRLTIIDASENNAPIDAARVREHYASDVPNILWWSPDQLIEHDLFAAFFEQADRVIVDSSGTLSDESTLRRLLCFIEPLTPLRDLAWMRSAPWREMIAQFFDHPRVLADLDSLRALRIVSGSSAEALYLAAWMASRLGWTPKGSNAFQTGEGSHITFEHTLRGEKRRITEVELTSATSRYTAQVSEDEHVVALSISGAYHKPPWLVPLHDIDNASLIEEAILNDADDCVHEAALQSLRELFQ